MRKATIRSPVHGLLWGDPFRGHARFRWKRLNTSEGRSAALHGQVSCPCHGSFWLGAPGDWTGQCPSSHPRRQIFCTVEGEYEMTASDGEVRCFPAGSVLLVEDIDR